MSRYERKGADYWRGQALLGLARQKGEALTVAASCGDEHEIALLIEQGADPNYQDHMGMTALMWAVRRMKRGAVKALLRHCDARISTKTGGTALMYAANSPDVDILRDVIPVSDPLFRDEEGETALMLAAHSNLVDNVMALLPVSDATAVNDDDESALGLAAWNPEVDLDLFDALLSASGHSPKALWSAIESAIHSNNEILCRRLLPWVTDATRSRWGETPLMAAAIAGNARLVEMLLPRSDIYAVDRESNLRAEDFAERHGHPLVANLIKGYVLSKIEHKLLRECAPMSTTKPTTKRRGL